MDRPPLHGYARCGCYVGVWHAVIPPPMCAYHARRLIFDGPFATTCTPHTTTHTATTTTLGA